MPKKFLRARTLNVEILSSLLESIYLSLSIFLYFSLTFLLLLRLSLLLFLLPLPPLIHVAKILLPREPSNRFPYPLNLFPLIFFFFSFYIYIYYFSFSSSPPSVFLTSHVDIRARKQFTFSYRSGIARRKFRKEHKMKDTLGGSRNTNRYEGMRTLRVTAVVASAASYYLSIYYVARKYLVTGLYHGYISLSAKRWRTSSRS